MSPLHRLLLILLISLAGCSPAPGSAPAATSPATTLPPPGPTASPLPSASATQPPAPSTAPTASPSRTFTAQAPTASQAPTLVPTPTSGATPTFAPTTAATPPTAMDFSALGSGRIIFSSTHFNPAAELYLAQPASGRVLRLIGNLFADNLSPRFSPDGKQVVFSSNPGGNFNLFLMDVDEAVLADFPEDLEQTLEPFDWLERLNIQQLTNTPMNELDPAWSPDGKSIAFIGAENLSQDLYVLQLPSAQTTRLTEDLWLRSPRWSPDGTKIIFEDESMGGGADLAWVPSGGGERIKLSEAPWISDRAPAWSPDGNRIAFCRMTELVFTLTLVNADGSGLQQLNSSTSSDCQPTWSPDGSQILFVSDRGGSRNLWVMPASGADQRQLTFFERPNENLQADWVK